MPESITLFCKSSVDDLDTLNKSLGLLDPTNVKVDVESAWRSIEVSTKNGRVQLNRKVFERRADDFSRLVWTTVVEFRTRSETNPEGAKLVEKHLDSTKAVIGVVAEPGFDDITLLPELIGVLASEYEAIIFNGSEMLDFRGNTIA